jgi:hypothetical protein
MLSWLASLSNVVNRPSPQGLSGPMLSPAQWGWLAAECGIATEPSVAPAPRGGLRRWRHALVLGTRIFGDPLPDTVAHASARLAAAMGIELLGLTFCHHGADGAFRLALVETTPDLRTGGETFLDALHGRFSMS